MKKGNIGDGLVFHAGFPNAAEDRPLGGALSLDSYLIKHPVSTFFWRLEQIEPTMGWPAGSLLVIDKGLDPKTGDTVAVVSDDDFGLRILRNRQFYRLDGQEDLTENVFVWGVVTHVIQALRK